MTLTELILLHERMTRKNLQLTSLFSLELEAWAFSEGRSQEPHFQSYKSIATSKGISKATVEGKKKINQRVYDKQEYLKYCAGLFFAKNLCCDQLFCHVGMVML